MIHDFASLTSQTDEVNSLASSWIYALIPMWFMMTLAWMLMGALDICRGIFRELVKGEFVSLARWRLGGAGGVLGGMALAAAPAVAFQRVQERTGCDVDCSVFANHRTDAAWLSFQYSLIAAAAVGLVWFISARRNWRWMG